MMFRATSEIAVAIKVRSLPTNPAFAANSRPSCGAVTMSAWRWTATHISTAKVAALRGCVAQNLKALLQIQRGGHALEGQPKLDQGDRHLRLDAHDHRPGATQTRRGGNSAERARREGIHHVQRADVDDHAARAQPADFL